ncbi:MAG: thiolase domain-containing protein [Anaerolineae bacterium]|nr:thiolase domain-containing protein [Anaerolineae bacterium]
MRDVCIIGIGQTPLGELWDRSLRHLAFDALQAAANDAGLAEAGIDRPDALFVGNMLSARTIDQAQLGALIADFCGWRGIEAATVEAACASGGAAFQAGVRAVASGMVDVAAVCGVEKMTDVGKDEITSALATAADADYEVVHGVTFVALNALVMQRYMYEYDIPHEAFANFAVNAHQNAVNNPNAMFRRAIKAETYNKAAMIAPPVNLFDSSPVCDGAAAAILCPLEMARDLSNVIPVRVLASTTGTDSLNLDDRHDMLSLNAARISVQKAYDIAGVGPEDIDLFELHDAFTIMATLSLEASGFAERGHGTDLARSGEIAIGGRVPICTMGGLKARGHPVGATGVYGIVDAVTQLRGEAGENQVQGAGIAMAQNIGGTGSTVVTHILGV